MVPKCFPHRSMRIQPRDSDGPQKLLFASRYLRSRQQQRLPDEPSDRWQRAHGQRAHSIG